MEPDGRNPAFQRANPHGTRVIGLLLHVLLFGVSPGCLRAVPRVRSEGRSGDVSRRCLRAFSRVLERKLELEIELELARNLELVLDLSN